MAEVRRKTELDYYKVLQVDPNAEPEVIEAAYRALSKKYHPDINRSSDSENRMSQLNLAFDVLRDADKRRDYNQIRDSLNRYARAAAATPPTPSPVPPRPTPTQPRQTTQTAAHPASNMGDRTRTKEPFKSADKSKSRSNYFINQEREEEGGFNIFPWIAGVVALLVLAIGSVLLMESLLGNPLGTNILTAKNNNTRPTQVAVLTSGAQTQPANTPIPTGVLSREGALAFLQTPDMFDRRVLDLQTTVPDGGTKSDALRLTIRLSEKGGATNAETFATSAKPDPLDLLRQSEATTYALVYSLFRQYPDLNRLTINLTDPKDEKRMVYKADMTRSSAFSFSPWRGDMNPAVQSLADLTRAATEDRLASHYGASLDDQSHRTINQPNQDNLMAEIAAWQPTDNIQAKLEGSGTVSIGYLSNKSEQQYKSDWARIFYALYTRFPNLDRINITRGVPGTTTGEVRTNERALFNRITQAGWGQRVFASGVADPKSVIDSLPNDPTLAYVPPPVNAVEVKPGGSGKGKNWEIAEANKPLTQTKIGNLTSIKGKFFQVTIKVTNLGSGRDWPNPLQLFSLVDGQGTIYRPNVTAASVTYLNQNVPPFGPIEAGKSFPILLVFDIPDTATNLRLQMIDDTSSVLLNFA